MTFNLPVSWDSSGLGRFLSLPLVSDELECSEECQSHVLYNVPQLSFACCLPLIIILRLCVFRRKITEVKLSSHPIKGTNSQHALSCWWWPWSPAQGPGCQLPLPPAALPTLRCPLCKVTTGSPHSRAGVRSTCLKAEQLQKLFGIVHHWRSICYAPTY